MGNVVRARFGRQSAENLSPTFLTAWDHFPDSGRLRSSKREAWPAWAIEADRAGGEDRLLAAVQRYFREDREHRRDCGAPAFHRWLKNGRWEHWLPKADVTPIAPLVFADAELRASFQDRFSEDALRWLDRCGWSPDRREISSPTRTLKDAWVRGPFNRWAKEQGVKALIFL